MVKILTKNLDFWSKFFFRKISILVKFSKNFDFVKNYVFEKKNSIFQNRKFRKISKFIENFRRISFRKFRKISIWVKIFEKIWDLGQNFRQNFSILVNRKISILVKLSENFFGQNFLKFSKNFEKFRFGSNFRKI